MSLWHDTDETIAALRRELERRGLPVAVDTIVLQRSLALLEDDGTSDQVRAVFQIAANVDAAMPLLIDGRWPPSMPARVLVLPAAEAASGGQLIEMMEQIGVRVLLSEAAPDGGPPGACTPGAPHAHTRNDEAGEGLAFPGLEDLLADLD
jgi:hypothetical protein